jgi:hypothetical protein
MMTHNTIAQMTARVAELTAAIDAQKAITQVCVRARMSAVVNLRVCRSA